MSSTLLWFLIIGGIFFALFVLGCIATGIFAFRAQASAQKLSSEQKPWRLPTDKPLPKALRDDLSRAGAGRAIEERPFKIFRDWSKTQNGHLEIDYVRFAQAMEHSGISPSVNWVNTWIIGQTLKQS